jgi:hypothetical protein
VKASLNAAVPAAFFVRSKVSVCQPPATVVTTSASTLLAALCASSSLSLTVAPASGDQTFIVMVWSAVVASSLPPSVRKVVPAQVSAPAVFRTAAALPEPPAGGVADFDDAAPPKSLLPPRV